MAIPAQTATEPGMRVRKRGLIERLGITLANGGRVGRDDLVMGMILFLPGFIVLVLLGTYPIINVITLAFQDRPLLQPEAARWVALDNFAMVVSRPLFWVSLRNGLVFTAATVLAQTVLGLAVAVLLHQNFPARNIFRSLILFSYVFPMAVAAIIWRFMLSDSVGIIYHTIRAWQLPIPNTWFTSPRTAMATVVMIAVWKFFPFMVINFLARLQTIDEQLYEAAKVDGASSLQAFRHITMPALMPVIIIVMLLRTIWTFNNWDVVALLTKGGPLDSTRTLPLLVYDTMFSQFSMGRAAATAVMMTALLLVAMVYYLRAYHRSEERLT
jgi:multiple sugar transport system permease protein